jgi:Tfp pilus assembly protein PilV
MAARRTGLSLLEIIIAMAVLTGSATMLAQIVGLGARHAERSWQISQAQAIAQNILNELLADMRPWETSDSFLPVDPWSKWDYQLQIEPLGISYLSKVTVTVTERADEAAADAGAERPRSIDQKEVTNRRQYRLVRWVRRETTTEDERGALARRRKDDETR